MLRKYTTGLLALAIAIGGAAFTNAGKKMEPRTGKFTNYYYKFTGAHGSEGTVANWMQLTDLEAYNDESCPTGSVKGCKIINTTNSGGHPTSVPLSSGFPTATSPNVAVQQRGN